MLDNRMNASTPLIPSEAQCVIEGRPHEGHTENSDQCRRAGKAGRGQSQAITFLTKQIGSWRRDIFETKQRREMRTVTYGINCAFEDDTSSGSFNHNDRNGFLRRCVGVGSADNAQNISSFTIPPRGGGYPFFPAIYDPIAAL